MGLSGALGAGRRFRVEVARLDGEAGLTVPARMRRQPEREMPPGRRGTAALKVGTLLGREAVRSVSVGAFEGFHRRSHPFLQRTAQKPTDRVWLPAGRLHEVLKCYAAGPLQQIEDLGSFATLASGAAVLTGTCCLFRRYGLPGRLGRRWRDCGRLLRTARLSGASFAPRSGLFLGS
jgi:hypothetical protein